MTRPPRDPVREAALIRKARESIGELVGYYAEVRLRSPERTVRKALSLLDFVKQVSR